MYLVTVLDELLKEIKNIFEQMDKEKTEKMIEEFLNTKRVFIAGTGRSLLVGKMFAVRLVQMGHTVHMVGDPITPSIKEGDLLLAISGSGETHTTVYVAQEARKKNIRVISITAKKESPLAKLSNIIIHLPTKTKNEMNNEVFPLGTLFELSALLFLDGVVSEIKKRKQITEEEMKKEHANLE